jgi:hypothetical protein
MEWPGAGRALRALPVAGASPGVGTGADRLPGRARDPPRRCPQRCFRDSARASHNVVADGPALPVRGPPATDLAASRVRTGRHHASHLPGGRFPWGLAFNGAAVADEGFRVSCGDVLRPDRVATMPGRRVARKDQRLSGARCDMASSHDCMARSQRREQWVHNLQVVVIVGVIVVHTAGRLTPWTCGLVLRR